jgi:hypothetical protein
MSERPTPHSIAVCALIALHSDPSSPLHELGLSLGEQHELTQFLEENACGLKSNANLGSLLRHARQQLGNGIAILLEETLEMAAESIDSLIDLMDSLRVAITEGLVDAVSSHGVFLRMICLGFEEISFESAALLWEDLKEKLCKSDEMVDDSEQEQSVAKTTSWPLSTKQMESSLRQDCLDLQTGRMADSDQSFESIELKIRSMIKKDSELPAAYFFRFMNCINHSERVGAMDALHQYFDLATVQHTSPKDILQFSAILLAVAHDAFGDTELSLIATEEAVRVAQQSKDKDAACVAFALGWLFKNNGHGTAEKRELLKRCATRALQGQLRPLVAGANLALAKHSLEEDRRAPSATWTSLMEVTSEQTADTLSSLDRPTYMSQVPNETMESMARQSLVSAGIWDAFNLPGLSGLSSIVALNHYEHLSANEVLSAVQNLSMLSMNGTSINFVRHHDLKATITSSESHSCVYANAISTLIRLQQDFGLDRDGLRGPYLHSVMLILHEWAVNRGDLEDAKALSLAIASYLHSGLPNFYQMAVDFEMQKCLRLCRERDWDTAINVIDTLLETCTEKGFKSQRARILLQLSVIQLEANTKQLMPALSPLLEVLSLCEEYGMHGLHSIACSILAKVELRLKNPKRALAIMKAAIPTLLQRGHIWFQAEAFLTLSKCHIQQANNAKNSRVKIQNLRVADMQLKRSQTTFDQCQDFFRLREVFYLQAQVYSQLEMVDEREATSKRFIDVSQYLNQRRSGSQSSIVESLSDSVELQKLLMR